MKRALHLLISMLLLSTASTATADSTKQRGDSAYVASASGQFGIVNLETGAFTQFGITPLLSGLARGPRHTIYGLDPDNNLVSLNPATGATAIVGSTGLAPAGENVTLLTSLENGKIFAVDANNILYAVNPRTGVATLIGSTGIPVPDFGTCNCVTGNGLAGAEDELIFAWEVAVDNPSLPPGTVTPSALYRINPHTGAAHRIGATRATAPIVGLGFIDDTFYGFTFGPAVGAPNSILKISRTTGHATFVTNQDLALDPVFGAIPVRIED